MSQLLLGTSTSTDVRRLPPSRAFHIPRSVRAFALLVTAAVLGVFTARFVADPGPATGAPLLLALSPFIAVVVCDVRRALLAVVIFDVALQLDLNLFYRPDAAATGAEGGLTLSLTTAALVGLYGIWAAQGIARPASSAPMRLRAAAPLLTYVGISAVSIAVADDRILGAFGMALLLEGLATFLYVASTVRRRGDVIFIVGVFAVALLFEGLFIVFTAIAGDGASALGASPGADGGSRFGGTLGSPNTAASFLSASLVIAAALALSPVGRVLRTIAILALPAGASALVLTQSRGAWLSLVVAMVALGWILSRGNFGISGAKAALPLAVAIPVLPLAGIIANRLTADDKGSAASRLPLVRLAWDAIRDHPVTGIGLNNLGPAFTRVYAGPSYSQSWIYTVHNKYLLIAAEAGPAALVAFVWFLWSSLRRGLQCARGADPVIAVLAAGLTAAFLGCLFHMTVEIYQSRPQVQLLCLIAALLVAMAALVSDNEPVGD